MPKIKFHQIAAVVVLICAALWIITGEFSVTGSAASEDGETDGAQAAAVQPDQDINEDFKTVGFVTAKTTPFSQKIRLSAQTEPDKRAILVARASGVIAQLPVSQGDLVEVDALVMAVDGPEKYSAVETAEAGIRQREREEQVARQLSERGSGSALQLETAQAGLSAAQSQLRQAQAEVDRLEVRAPFSGLVDDVSVELGSWAEPGTPAATLISLDPIIVVAEVSEQELPRLKTGGAAAVTFASGQTAEGTIRYIRREASSATRTFPVEISVPNTDLALSAGMTASITLDAAPVKSLVVPRSVLTLSDGGEIGVRVLDDRNRVSFQSVKIIDDTQQGIIVTGVEDGTLVIVAGQDLVTTGETVNAIDATKNVAAAVR